MRSFVLPYFRSDSLFVAPQKLMGKISMLANYKAGLALLQTKENSQHAQVAVPYSLWEKLGFGRGREESLGDRSCSKRFANPSF